jgi:hypothetical protein
MSFVLLPGVALNWLGAVAMVADVRREGPDARQPADYEQLKLFTAGTAATFGALYLYLFLVPADVIPFLIFGAALKTWAFVLSAALFLRRRLATGPFVAFGVTNLAVAVLFWLYVAVEAG